jgi:hypothetical protein
MSIKINKIFYPAIYLEKTIAIILIVINTIGNPLSGFTIGAIDSLSLIVENIYIISIKPILLPKENNIEEIKLYPLSITNKDIPTTVQLAIKIGKCLPKISFKKEKYFLIISSINGKTAIKINTTSMILKYSKPKGFNIK